jgi:hypothetical protein
MKPSRSSSQGKSPQLQPSDSDRLAAWNRAARGAPSPEAGVSVCKALVGVRVAEGVRLAVGLGVIDGVTLGVGVWLGVSVGLGVGDRLGVSVGVLV